ncbi:hypothetical protein H0H87_012154, partial [Tephrocybe sp. NHM501043]
MATFFVAFILMCFVKSTATAILIIGLAVSTIFILIIWCIQMFWEVTEFSWRQWFRRCKYTTGLVSEPNIGTLQEPANLQLYELDFSNSI